MYRKMQLIGLLFAAAVLAISLGIVIGTASADRALPQQQTPDNPVDESEDTPDDEDIEVRLDRWTVVTDSGYESDTGQAWVEIRSTRPQTITVTDGGALMAGGKMDQSTVTVPSDEPTRIMVDATKYEGMVGVSIKTDTGLYGHPIETSASILSVPASSEWLAVFAGVTVSFGCLIGTKRVKDWRRKWGVYRVDGN